MSFRSYLYVEIDLNHWFMNNTEDYNMSDFMREEVAIRDHFLHEAHPAPDVKEQLAAFMRQQELSEEDSHRNNKVKVMRIAAVLAVAASVAFVFLLLGGKQKPTLEVPAGAVVAYEATSENTVAGVTLQKGDEAPVMVKGNQVNAASGASDDTSNGEEAIVRNVLTTPRNATAEVTLPDGSVVTVNAGSRLTYPQSFRGSTREVELQGEAYFKVRHDASHPFIVKAGKVSTKVLGTEFNVRTYSPQDVHVTLLQGRVLVSSASSAKYLKPGEDASLHGGGLVVRSVDTEEFTAWKDGDFYFDNVSLLTVAKEIGKWYNVSVIFQSPEKMHTRLFFAAPRDGGIEELLEVLNSLNKAKFIYHDGQVVIE